MNTDLDKDPNELPDNFFQKEAIADEENFLKQFESPAYGNMPGLNNVVDENDNDNGDGDEGDEDDNAGTGTDDPVLDFDDALEKSEKEELEELNAKLGTNFESLNDLKKSFGKEEASNIEKEIQEEQSYIDYFKSVLDPKQYDDRKIVLEDKRMAYQQMGKDINNPEIQEEIEAEVEGLESSGALGYAARSIRDTVRQALEKKEAKVNDYHQKKQDAIKLTETQFKEGIQEEINGIFKAGTFMGVKPTKQDMIDIYRDINKNKQIQNSNSSPKEIVEFALFKKYKDILSKNLGKPSYKDGVKQALNDIGITAAQQTINGSEKDQGDADDKKSFYEQFVQ